MNFWRKTEPSASPENVAQIIQKTDPRGNKFPKQFSASKFPTCSPRSRKTNRGIPIHKTEQLNQWSNHKHPGARVQESLTQWPGSVGVQRQTTNWTSQYQPVGFLLYGLPFCTVCFSTNAEETIYWLATRREWTSTPRAISLNANLDIPITYKGTMWTEEQFCFPTLTPDHQPGTVFVGSVWSVRR